MTNSRIKLDFPQSAIFQQNYLCKKNIVINQGGTSSGKTYSILQVLLVRAWQEPGVIVTVAGQDIPNLKAGAMRDIETIFDQVPVFRDQIANHNKSDKTYYFKNGSLIEFKSYDDRQDAKNGKRDYLFVNEANGLPYDVFEELQVRTTKQVFIDYNPTAPFWAHHKLIGRADVQFLRSNYTHNEFIDSNIRKKIEQYKITDPERWRVYGLGYTGRVQGVVFPNITWVSQFPRDCKKVSYGLDFGFTNDPTALVKQGELGGERFAELLIYETGLTNSDLSDFFVSLGISKNAQMFADGAEPKSIATLRRLGWNIKAAPKGKDSILWGINKIKELPLNLVVSENFKQEALNYKWLSKDGRFLNRPIDKYNHAFDALRYSIAGREKKGNVIAYR